MTCSKQGTLTCSKSIRHFHDVRNCLLSFIIGTYTHSYTQLSCQPIVDILSLYQFPFGLTTRVFRFDDVRVFNDAKLFCLVTSPFRSIWRYFSMVIFPPPPPQHPYTYTSSDFMLFVSFHLREIIISQQYASSRISSTRRVKRHDCRKYYFLVFSLILI